MIRSFRAAMAIVLLLFLSSNVFAYTIKEIMSPGFGLENEVIATYDTVILNSANNEPQKAFQLLMEMKEQLTFIIEQVKNDPKQLLMFKKKMLVTSIVALFYTQVQIAGNPTDPIYKETLQRYLKEFVNFFGFSCVQLVSATPTKDNKLNVSNLQQGIYDPIAKKLFQYLKARNL